MTGLNRGVKIGLGGAAVLLLSLLAWLLLVGRPKPVEYRDLLAFTGEPTPEQRDQTMAILRARLLEFADPEQAAVLSSQPDGTILLSYRSSAGPGDLARMITVPGRCEFRFLHPDQRRVPDALANGPPEGYEIVNYLETWFRADEKTGEAVSRMVPTLVEREPVLKPRSFRDVTFRTQGIIRETHVRLEFHPDDAAQLAKAIEERPGVPLGILVDGVIRIGVIGRMGDGVLETQGLLDNVPAEKLAKILRHGPLPLSLRIIKSESTSLD